MKTVIIIGDGMSDHPVARLDGKTPLQVAKKPNIDRMAREGRIGLFQSIPKGMSLGSAVANLNVLGYDPRVTFQGRAVLEAANMGIELAPEDVAVRVNLICAEDGMIKNHSAGHISTEEADQLIAALDEELGGGQGDRPVTFHTGISYRHLLVLRGGWAAPEVALAPPHDHVGEMVVDLLPTATADTPEARATAERFRELHERAIEILAAHPVNQKRVAEGKDAAVMIWPWSPGRKPEMKTFQELYGVKGAVISAVDLVMGLGVYAGFDVIRVSGATGLWDTNYEGKAEAALDALADHDLVYLHVEATDEAGHAKDLDLKIKCIEMLDERVVGPVLRGLEERGIEAIVTVLPDHPTPVETGCHAGDAVPVAVWGHGVEADEAQVYDEVTAASGGLGMLHGDAFIRSVMGAK